MGKINHHYGRHQKTVFRLQCHAASNLVKHGRGAKFFIVK